MVGHGSPSIEFARDRLARIADPIGGEGVQQQARVTCQLR